MAEAPMEISTTAQQQNEQFNRMTTTAGGQHTIADVRVKEATDRAKQNLLSEIEASYEVSESAGGSQTRGFTEEETAEHLFNVMNPIKMDD